VRVMRVQDELESGQRSRRSGMSLQQQVGHYRRKLLQKVRPPDHHLLIFIQLA
ncbi:hypothetical protein CRUP_031417, partial [Coryphaenoides rupestris]